MFVSNALRHFCVWGSRLAAGTTASSPSPSPSITTECSGGAATVRFATETACESEFAVCVVTDAMRHGCVYAHLSAILFSASLAFFHACFPVYLQTEKRPGRPPQPHTPVSDSKTNVSCMYLLPRPVHKKSTFVHTPTVATYFPTSAPTNIRKTEKPKTLLAPACPRLLARMPHHKKKKRL